MVLVLLALAAGCRQPEAAPPVPSGPVDPAEVRSARQACLVGDVADGLGTLDAVLAAHPDHADALVARGLCRWSEFTADSSRTALAGAYDDLTEAIEILRDEGRTLALAEAYGHRAYVESARHPRDAEAALPDLDEAVAAAPRQPDPALDRAVARLVAGDSAGATSDFRRFLALADSADTGRIAFVERALVDLAPPASGETRVGQ